jgi:Planctomycete cytochrome C/WD domain, G-beta repeat
MRRHSYRFCILCGLLAALATWLMLEYVPAANAQGKQISFINDVAPIFKENCFACHDAKKRSGKFEMTVFDKLVDDERVVPGKSADSELYQLIVGKDDRRMPPKKDNLAPLSKQQAEVVKLWIDQGAKLDGGINPNADLVKELRIRWKPPAPPAAYKYPVIINALVFTPDNQQLVIGGHHELTVWKVADGKLLKRIYTRAERAYAMAFLPDGKLVVAGGRPGQEGDLRIFDIGGPGKTENGVAILDGVNDPKVMLKQLLDVDDAVLCMAISADGKRIVSGGCDRIVRVWDIGGGIANSKLEQSIENHADWVLGVALAPDGKLLLTCSRDKTAKVWDLTAKESVLTFPEHQNSVFGVAVKTDGKMGFSAGLDRKVRMWNTSGDGKQVKELGGHNDDILKLVAHPTMPIFVTTSADKTVKVWDEDKGTNTKTLSGLTDHVFAAAISLDGALVAAGAYDGEVKVWKIADGALVKGFNASPGYVAPSQAVHTKK